MVDQLDLAVRWVAGPLSALMALNGFDDLFVDGMFYFLRLFEERDRRLSVADLKSLPQQRIAILIPAWHEAEVIQQMLEANISAIDYNTENFDIFVGTYPNDLKTRQKVDLMARVVRNIHNVVTPHDGPTTKADNLNWIYQGMRLEEDRSGREYDILLMHDAEDVIHPLSLRLYNYFVPQYDLVQTPVLPLPTPLRKLVAGTYIDEFTEHHLKDMLVRGRIGGLVPSAGVGTAFARDSFEEIALSHSQLPFNPASVTEDYEIGLKVRLAGKKAKFITRAVRRLVRVERGIFRKRMVTREIDEFVATREFFPDTFRTAARQRSRWVLGIVFQAWEQVGWPGSLAVKYCLYRDRKAAVTSFLSPLGYLVVFYCLFRYLFGLATGTGWSLENVFVPGSILWDLVLLNTLLMLWRIAMKWLLVDKIFGLAQALMSLPRFFVGSMLNLVATSRALVQYLAHRVTGDPLRWAKTHHAFPSLEALSTHRKRLGDLLVDREGITAADLEFALRLQLTTGLRLGEICLHAGLARPEAISSALSFQLAMSEVAPNPYDVPLDLLRAVPEAEAERLDILPLSASEDGSVTVATASPPTDERHERLLRLVGNRVMYVLAPADKLKMARERAYRRLAKLHEAKSAPLGERLVAEGRLSIAQLDRALLESSNAGEPLGERLVRLGLLGPEGLSDALRESLKVGFRSVAVGDALPEPMRRLGYGFCKFYGMGPIRSNEGPGVIEIAASHLLHAEVLAECAARLECAVRPVLAPRSEVRLLLALANVENSRRRAAEGLLVGGMDGAELAAIEVAVPSLGPSLVGIGEAAEERGLSPIDYLENTGKLPPGAIANIRARALGLALADPNTQYDQTRKGWLSPTLESHGIGLIETSAAGLIVAAPRPTPNLARQLADLFPDTPIAWRVSLPLQGAPAHRSIAPLGES